MSTRDLLVEIGTEELPPKVLQQLARAFENSISSGLKNAELPHGAVQHFATPRRLALLVRELEQTQQDKAVERFGPAVAAAFDSDGKPTPAATGFARSCGVEVSDLQHAERDGVNKLYFQSQQKGQLTADLLPAMIDKALADLPIPKRMRWGASREEFVRPVHWVVLLFGDEVIDTEILGISTDRYTRGHRFHHNEPIRLDSPASYESVLEKTGQVIADFEKRRDLIRELVERAGAESGAQAIIEEDLLAEVTSLVEYPVALVGSFDEHFLQVPQEALILAMKSHQKCFYLVDEQKNLLPQFITISNLKSQDPQQVIQGNERVIRPRLADARFFFETDKQTPLIARAEQLKQIVFQEKLGTVYEKSQRVQKLSSFIATKLNVDPVSCERAALLGKCDLLTNMVGEFADLQGLMGYYYAKHDGEDEEVAQALREQYLPRFSGDQLPASNTGRVLALADKIDSITGMFAIGQPPTGSKDPFALRRAALGILRILVELQLDLDLRELIDESLGNLQAIEVKQDVANVVFEFLLERFRAWYQDEGIRPEVFQAVFLLKPSRPLDFHKRITAVHNFCELEQAAALAAANKRVTNILSKLSDIAIPDSVNNSKLIEDAEQKLAENLDTKKLEVAPLFESGEYTEGLRQLASLKDTVDAFFDEVLVMSDDDELRDNRLALLNQLRNLFLQTADISCLHTN